MELSFYTPNWCDLSWSEFVPLPTPKASGRTIPTGAGVYRVRVVGRDVLAYIGQTGRNLKERLQGLGKGLRAAEMPFNDPHTAAPKLWSYRDAEGVEFEASAAEVAYSKPGRMACECWLVWRYRHAAGRSTLCNFGRLHPRYETSGNRSTGVRGRRLSPDEPDNTGGTSPSPLALRGTPGSADWMGLDWSAAAPLTRAAFKGVHHGPGVYRLSSEANGVVYIGQATRLAKRLRTHALRAWGSPVMYSFAVMPDGYETTQLLEIENDLIAGYFEEFRAAPLFQFRKRSAAPPEES